MRIIWGVSTVKRAFPEVTTASGLASGLLPGFAHNCTKQHVSRASKERIVFFIGMMF